mmetsp:Transcript_35273/g.81904  ORF Transcript_35273/g.81904 Transcript_35273/m.81904 type:complete len:101 (+) Transcript_35273:2-304(+)
MTDMPALFEQFGVDLFDRAVSGTMLPPQCAPVELPAGQALRNDASVAPTLLRQLPWHFGILLLVAVAVASFAGGIAVARVGCVERSSALQKLQPPLLDKV